MNISDLSVFVYGTLKPGGRYWPKFCEGKVDEPIPARVKGQLYDMHLGFPGFRLDDEGWTYGHLLTFKTEEDFLRLDYLEGYDPDRPYSKNEYIRKRAQVYSTQGKPLGEVWIYEITDHMMEDCQATRIPSGNWKV
ncbi:hypothetical protein DDZ13_00285 [Coraliomargarita sinensis]|uniref:Gamma-glutamylcyclotransferase AIG2-like domain-containing protein n=1 Tax=Coraliomargarita sinensis TaxID=2174842 RepID=A0A317ZMC9_9BACT|nr:gamma-glutamylcyclotransferase family protein [Coraliomargarita sinensis]PXA05337.1 hypothetical protein DDZ13_00285 [Coraliomargarita sinensis]